MNILNEAQFEPCIHRHTTHSKPATGELRRIAGCSIAGALVKGRELAVSYLREERVHHSWWVAKSMI